MTRCEFCDDICRKIDSLEQLGKFDKADKLQKNYEEHLLYEHF